MYSSIIPWKTTSTTYITSSIQKNKNDAILTKYNLHNAPPLKIYRKEIIQNSNSTNSRSGMTIKSFEIPNGTIKTDVNNNNCLQTVINSKDLHIKDCLTNCNTLSTQQNARNRTRTCGIINKNYSTDTKQYLKKQGISFEQNQFNYLRSNGQYEGQISETQNNNNVIYKPNNSQFACDGSVDSSSYILRKKYNTITTNTNTNKYSSHDLCLSNNILYKR